MNCQFYCPLNSFKEHDDGNFYEQIVTFVIPCFRCFSISKNQPTGRHREGDRYRDADLMQKCIPTALQ